MNETNFIKKSNNSLRENQSHLKAFLHENISHFKNSKVRYYYSSCLTQAIEFSDIQLSSSDETRPLMQFYSLLSLVKFLIMTKQFPTNITLSDVEQLFKSHGASGDSIDGLTLLRNGTAYELATFLGNSYAPKEKVSLKSLYKRIPDICDLISAVFNEDSDCIKVTYPAGIFESNGSLIFDENSCKCDKNLAKTIIQEYPECEIKYSLTDADVINCKNITEKLLQVMSFDMYDNCFFDLNRNGFDEIYALYLIFLKYSLLSRYKPNSWYQKLKSKENMIIEQIMDNLYLKEWGLITQKICNIDKIII